MPYGVRREVAVPLVQVPGLLYAFRTDVATASSTALGHVDAMGTNGRYKPGVIFGINSPKPPRAKKQFSTATKNYEESFIDPAKIATARADGWKMKAGKLIALRNTKFSKMLSVDYKIVDPIDATDTEPAQSAKTMKYVWRVPQYQYLKLLAEDKTALGIKEFDPSKLDEYIYGADVRPQRATKTISFDGRQVDISTFVAWNKVDDLLSASNTSGWSLAA